MSVILPSVYKDGTASVTNGGTVVTGQSTLFVNAVLPGDFFGVHKGYAIRIASVDSNTQLTLANPWPGSTQTTAAYEIMLQSDTARMQETSRQLLTTLSSGNNYSLSQLVGGTEEVVMFSSPGVLTTVSKQSLTQGVDFDAFVDTLAERATYDSQATGYTVLVANVGDGRSAIYVKNSGASADWSDPAYISGPTGPAGIQYRGNYSGSTSYVLNDVVQSNGSSWINISATTGNAPPTLPTTSNTWWNIFAVAGSSLNPRGDYNAGTSYSLRDGVVYNGSYWINIQATTGNAPPASASTTSNTWWQLVAAKGVDGTGTGDVVGPSSAVDGNIAAFDGATGKLIEDTGLAVSDVVKGPSSAIDNSPVSFNGTTGKLIKTITGPISALHALTPASNKMPYFTGASAAALTDITAFARTLIDDSDGATAFATMGALAAKTAPGYVKLPNGIIIQWGTADIISASTVVVTLPIQYPTARLFNIAGMRSGGATTVILSTDPGSVSAFTIYANTTVVATATWLSIGY